MGEGDCRSACIPDQRVDDVIPGDAALNIKSTRQGTSELIRRNLSGVSGGRQPCVFRKPCDLVHADCDGLSVDKKNLNNKLNVILLKDIGTSYIHPTTSAFFDRRSEWMM